MDDPSANPDDGVCGLEMIPKSEGSISTPFQSTLAVELELRN